MAQTEQEASGGDQSYFDEVAGVGLENFTPETVSVAYLSMVQPDSSAAANHTPGTWRNSATDKNYGPSVKVIPLAFKTVWTERDKVTFMTVGRYEPNSIEVQTTYPKPGQRGFPERVNPVTGNKVEELFVYAVVLADAPEEGVLYLSPTVSSMTACKQWNTLIRSRRLPDGRPAGICSYQWTLFLELVPNPKQLNKKICKFTKVADEGLVPGAYYADNIRPQLAAAKNIQLLAAPEQSGDAE